MALSLVAPVVGIVKHPLLQTLWYSCCGRSSMCLLSFCYCYRYVTGATTIGSGVQYLYQMKGYKVLDKKPP